jgi:hypothetical protein
MKDISDLVAQVIERRHGVLETSYLHQKRITIRTAKHDPGAYFIDVEGFYGRTPEEAIKGNDVHHEYLTGAGYSRVRTLRHPKAGELSVYCVEDDILRTESREIADFTAYALGREVGMKIAERLGYPFDDKIKR